jgi:hypothetical protein
MKKVLGIAVVLALAVMLMPAAVFAADPVEVGLGGSTDRLWNSVTGSFVSGKVTWSIDTITTPGTHVATTTMDVLTTSLGDITILSEGYDVWESQCRTLPWNPDQVGEQNGFWGTSTSGGWTGTYKVTSNANFGELQSFINVAAKAGGADFQMTDTQYFNIMSGNRAYNVVGNFFAHASGNDDQVAMNLKSVGSAVVWSEATNNITGFPGPGLRGNWIEKEVWVKKGGVPMTDLYLGVSTNGIASIANVGAWGFDNRDSGILSSTNYNRPYNDGSRTVSATGAGQLIQTGFGLNSLTFSGTYTFPGGGSTSLTTPGGFDFNNGMSGTYSMEGY